MSSKQDFKFREIINLKTTVSSSEMVVSFNVLNLSTKMREGFWVSGEVSQLAVLEQLLQTLSCLWLMNTHRKGLEH